MMKRTLRKTAGVFLFLTLSLFIIWSGWVPIISVNERTNLLTKSHFDINADDVFVVLHIPNTGMGAMTNLLTKHLITDTPCTCQPQKTRCSCLNSEGNPWLFNAYNVTGFPCGEFSDFTNLTRCPIDYWMQTSGQDKRTQRRYIMMTMLRDPMARYVSEWLHFRRQNLMFKNEPRMWRSQAVELQKKVLPCLMRKKIPNLSLQDFIACEENPANNRQTRMLANLTRVRLMRLKDRAYDEALLRSAKNTLQTIPFFGILNHLEKTETLFRHDFDMRFDTELSFTSNEGEQYLTTVDPTVHHEIAAANHLDVRLYRFAAELFESRYKIATTLPTEEEAQVVDDIAKQNEETIAISEGEDQDLRLDYFGNHEIQGDYIVGDQEEEDIMTMEKEKARLGIPLEEDVVVLDRETSVVMTTPGMPVVPEEPAGIRNEPETQPKESRSFLGSLYNKFFGGDDKSTQAPPTKREEPFDLNTALSLDEGEPNAKEFPEFDDPYANSRMRMRGGPDDSQRPDDGSRRFGMQRDTQYQGSVDDVNDPYRNVVQGGSSGQRRFYQHGFGPRESGHDITFKDREGWNDPSNFQPSERGFDEQGFNRNFGRDRNEVDVTDQDSSRQFKVQGGFQSPRSLVERSNDDRNPEQEYRRDDQQFSDNRDGFQRSQGGSYRGVSLDGRDAADQKERDGTDHRGYHQDFNNPPFGPNERADMQSARPIDEGFDHDLRLKHPQEESDHGGEAQMDGHSDGFQSKQSGDQRSGGMDIQTDDIRNRNIDMQRQFGDHEIPQNENDQIDQGRTGSDFMVRGTRPGFGDAQDQRTGVDDTLGPNSARINLSGPQNTVREQPFSVDREHIDVPDIAGGPDTKLEGGPNSRFDMRSRVRDTVWEHPSPMDIDVPDIAGGPDTKLEGGPNSPFDMRSRVHDREFGGQQKAISRVDDYHGDTGGMGGEGFGREGEIGNKENNDDFEDGTRKTPTGVMGRDDRIYSGDRQRSGFGSAGRGGEFRNARMGPRDQDALGVYDRSQSLSPDEGPGGSLSQSDTKFEDSAKGLETSDTNPDRDQQKEGDSGVETGRGTDSSLPAMPDWDKSKNPASSGGGWLNWFSSTKDGSPSPSESTTFNGNSKPDGNTPDGNEENKPLRTFTEESMNQEGQGNTEFPSAQETEHSESSLRQDFGQPNQNNMEANNKDVKNGQTPDLSFDSSPRQSDIAETKASFSSNQGHVLGDSGPGTTQQDNQQGRSSDQINQQQSGDNLSPQDRQAQALAATREKIHQAHEEFMQRKFNPSPGTSSMSYGTAMNIPGGGLPSQTRSLPRRDGLEGVREVQDIGRGDRPVSDRSALFSGSTSSLGQSGDGVQIKAALGS